MNPAKPRPNLWLYGYVGLIFTFVFTPIITTVVFAFDVNRYPRLPMGA
jgi:ABC-type spermidine/putrescine transport system permease subunit II